MAFDVQKTSIEITAVDKTKVAFDSVKSSIGNLTSQFGALTGLLGAGAFVAFTKRIIDQADSMNDLSKRTGIAVEQIGAWRLATEQSGTSMEALTLALGKGSKYLVEHGDNLKKIGINAKTSEELILQLSGIISKMPSDDPRRTALAMQVLGKSAGELIPLLSEGEAGLRKMLERGRELNPVTKEMAENADKFNDSLAEMKLVSNGLFVNLVGKILPSLNTYLQQLHAIVNEGDWMDKLLFFTLGYVPGKIADKTESPADRIKAYTKEIANLQNQLKNSQLTGLPDQDYLKKQIAEAQAGLDAQRARLPFRVPKHSSNPSNYDATNLDAFLKSDSNATPKKNAIAERIKALGVENSLLAQGVPLEDARTIARLKGDGATDQQIVKMLNATSVQNQYEAAEKSAEKTKQDLIKATQDHADAMKQMLATADEAVLSAQRDYEESNRSLQVMQLGESAVIRMEAARLNEAAASAEQGLAYARLNGLSQENIDFTETQILKLHQLADARLKLADSADAKTAFEKEKQRILDLEKAQKDSTQRIEDNQKRFYDDLSQALTNSLFNGFKKGENFAKSFGKNLIALAKTWILQPTIQAIFSPVAGTGLAGGIASLFSGSASAGGASSSGGGLGSLLSGGSSIMNLISSGNNAIVSGIESLGTFLSTGSGGLGDMLGGAIGQYAGAISNVLPFAGAAFSLLTGDIKGAVSQGIGAGIGLAIGGPVGGILGSVAGSLLGGMFGGGHVIRPKYYANTQVSASGTSVLNSYKNEGPNSDIAKAYGLNVGGAIAATAAQLGGTIQKAFQVGIATQQKYDAVNITLGGAATNKVYGQAFATGEATRNGSLTAQAVLKSMQLGFVSMDGYIKKIVMGAASDIDSSLSSLNNILGLKTLHDSLADLPPIFDKVRQAIEKVATSQSLNVMTTAANQTKVFFDLFYSDIEKLNAQSDLVHAHFAKLSVGAFPDSRDAFRKLVEGIDTATSAGFKQYYGLTALAPEMDAYYKALVAQSDAASSATDSLNVLTDSFATLVDYQRYKGVSATYGDAFAKDYTFNLGTGRIAHNADGSVTSSSATGGGSLVEQIKELRAELNAALVSVALSTQATANFLKRWNGDGMPEVRTLV